MFHLGDVVANNWLESDYKLYFDPFANCIPQVFFALGNHELYNATMEDVAVIYDDLLANKTYLKGNPEGFYYYFDDNARKIRYLVINTSDGSCNAVTNEQIAWISESVQLPSTEWKLIVFGHMDIMPDDPIMDEWNTGKETEITNALSTTNGALVGYFCGHEHCDLIQKVNNKFYEIILLNDSCVKDDTFEEVINPERTAGTVSEQAVSVVSINTTTGDVIIRRIGAGSNMTYNYIGDEPIEPDEPDIPEDVTLLSISATYAGGNVAVGTALSSLTGITVTATYSDGSTEIISGYTLSGEIIEGENTITVSYGGKTTTFIVTGVTNSDSEDEVSNDTKWTDGVAYTYEIIENEYVEKNGVLTPYNGWSRTPYLYCEGAKELRGVRAGGGNLYFLSYSCFFDENKNFIYHMYEKAAESDDYYYVSVPENASYFMISTATENFSNIKNNVYPSATTTT